MENIMNMTDKLLVTETDEIITVNDFINSFNEMESIGNALSNLEYSIKHGILKYVKE